MPQRAKFSLPTFYYIKSRVVKTEISSPSFKKSEKLLWQITILIPVFKFRTAAVGQCHCQIDPRGLPSILGLKSDEFLVHKWISLVDSLVGNSSLITLPSIYSCIPISILGRFSKSDWQEVIRLGFNFTTSLRIKKVTKKTAENSALPSAMSNSISSKICLMDVAFNSRSLLVLFQGESAVSFLFTMS